VTLLAVCTVVLVLVAVVAAVFVARAAHAIVAIHRQTTALYKQTKQILTNTQRTNASAKRILERQYEFAKKQDTVFEDPKVQAALNRHEEKHRGR
jgi:hypothetical protein